MIGIHLRLVRACPGDFRHYDGSSNDVFEAPWHRSNPPDVSRSTPVDLQVHRKGRCFASCCSSGALDHKRQQQLSFFFFNFDFN